VSFHFRINQRLLGIVSPVRALAALGLFGLLGTASVAAAQTPQTALAPPPPALPGATTQPMTLNAPPDSKEDSADAVDHHRAHPRKFGAMFDVGVPDGTMLSFVYRPIDLARFHAGAGYNGVSPGLRLGGALLPFGYGPSLSLEYGHYFEGDANGLVEKFTGPLKEGNEVLERFGYDYVSMRAGIELGGDRFTFFARGGITWLRSTIHNLDSLLEANQDENSNTRIVVKQDPVVNAFAPSLNLGFIVQL
jgi:hypothetical protein